MFIYYKHYVCIFVYYSIIFNTKYVNFPRESQDDLKQREYHLFFVPARSLLCEKRLEVSFYYL